MNRGYKSLASGRFKVPSVLSERTDHQLLKATKSLTPLQHIYCSEYIDHLNLYMLLYYVPGGELFSHLHHAGHFTPNVTTSTMAESSLP
ncbi:hypothetical protein BOTBODRAFT_174017 [Botryobasidium botryosum FD-172 SS1]|uniref:Protein kinase domain-containing protein n=1 Tax=Botryobasidium botryosum (strain FD-172 SS1) TaxID=930990 RepID=A0A067MHY8_BOTB1|nr:hypothetical protein BOTBODRAFT_174017 [Botryobasidium botryosum FD-172 SS1]